MNIKKHGQIAIWVIIAVVLVASIVFFFLLERKPGFERVPVVSSSFDVESFMDNCLADYVEEGVDAMLSQGGFISPRNTVFFDGENIEYICENIGFYEPCIQQHPMLISEMEDEIKNYVLPKINDCFNDMEREFERRGSEVSFVSVNSSLSVEFGEDRIFLYVDRELTIRKDADVRSFEELRIELVNPIYNLAKIAVEISSQEAKYCYFEFVGHDILYPRYKITKYVMSEPTKIYTIRDIKSGKEMNIAVRSCAIPAGF
ncbi:MAG: hypothetical protein ABIG28_02585 [archaeon]